MDSVHGVRVQLNPLHRGRSFVIVGVGWMCAGVVGVYCEEAGVADASGLLDVTVGAVM